MLLETTRSEYMHAFTILLFVGVPSNDQPADDDDDADTWCCSLVLVGQAVEDHPGDHVAADRDTDECVESGHLAELEAD